MSQAAFSRCSRLAWVGLIANDISERIPMTMLQRTLHSLAFQLHRAGSEVAGKAGVQAGCLTARQKQHTCPLFPKTTNAPSVILRVVVQSEPLDAQVAAADSPTAYSGHKQTVMNDEQVSWQVPSSI